MKIRLTINGQSTTATLIDNPATRDFVALLPMTLTVSQVPLTVKVLSPPVTLSDLPSSQVMVAVWPMDA